MIKYFFYAILLTLTACSSTHDLKRDGLNIFGGGFIDEELGPGVYFIKAFSNTSLISTPKSAANTFEYRAKQLCPIGYEEIRTLSNAYQSMTPGSDIPIPNKPGFFMQGPQMVITSKIGHIRCNDAPITINEAKSLVTANGE